MIGVPAHAEGQPLLAVIVLSVGAPPELADAVRSILDQGEAVELAVVNSGGGDVGARLPAAGRDIRVISVEDVLWPGAARNRGIAATTAPFVAFLAADCTAEPGWVAARLSHHLRGAAAVASAIVNSQPDNVAASLSHLLTYGRRDASLNSSRARRYGISYGRWLFDTYGAFREDLRLGEDSEFNLRMTNEDLPVWAPEVRTVHRNPTSLPALLRDRYERGRRQGQYWPDTRRVGFVDRLREAGLIAASDFDALAPVSATKRLPRFRLWAALLAHATGYRVGRRSRAPLSKAEYGVLDAMVGGHWRQASAALKQMRRRGAARYETALYAIICATRSGQAARARALAEEAVAGWPDNTSLSIRRARLAAQDDSAGALRLWDDHLARFGPGHAALAGRAAALLGCRRFDEARATVAALQGAFPYSSAAAWIGAEIAMASYDWTAALAELQEIFGRWQQPAALERAATLLILLGRRPEAEEIARLLEGVDLDGHLRIACMLARTGKVPEPLAHLAARHADRIAADAALLRPYLNALTAAGETSAAMSLIDRSPLPEGLLRPKRVVTLLSAGRHREAWTTFTGGKSNIGHYSVVAFRALLAAAHIAGGAETAAGLLATAEKADRPAVAAIALLERRRLADIAALGAAPPRLLRDPPPELPPGISPRELLRSLDQLRRTHPRFHAEPSLVLNDAVQVASAIAAAADRGEPLSLIRLGDGEGNLLPYGEMLRPFAELDRRATALHWWGEADCPADLSPIQRQLEAAIRDADIVGVPDAQRLLSLDRVDLVRSFALASKNIRGLHAALDFAVAEVPEDRFITSCHVHQALSSWGLWDLLLPRLAPLSLVTCHQELAPALAARFGTTIADVFLIPPERKHAARFASQIAGRHYPDRFEELRHQLRGIRRGQIVLVAAGVLGKIYCQWIKEAGGIGIDVGSAADAWIGHYTRSSSENASYAVLPGALEGLRTLARHDPQVAAIVG